MGVPQRFNSNKVRRGVSFADAVMPKHGQQWVPKKSSITTSKHANGEEEEQWKGMMFTVPPEDMVWLEKCYVGEARSPF